MSDTPRAFERFQETRRETLGLVEPLTQEQLDFSASPRQWSTGQVLDHLTLVDEFFRGEYEELLQRWRKTRRSVALFRTLSDSGFSLPLVPDVLLPLFDVPAAMAGVLFPRPVRQLIFASSAVPAKAPTPIRPRKGRGTDNLHQELEEFLGYLERYFATNSEVEWERLNYYNPVCGFTNLPGVMSFLNSHERRHQRQIHRILEAQSLPDGD